MASRTQALIAIATLVAAVTWLYLRAATVAELEILPARCRKRLRWCQRNNRYVYVGCLALALAAVLAQLPTLST
jgi:hypothetical protein